MAADPRPVHRHQPVGREPAAPEPKIAHVRHLPGNGVFLGDHGHRSHPGLPHSSVPAIAQCNDQLLQPQPLLHLHRLRRQSLLRLEPLSHQRSSPFHDLLPPGRRSGQHQPLHPGRPGRGKPAHIDVHRRGAGRRSVQHAPDVALLRSRSRAHRRSEFPVRSHAGAQPRRHVLRGQFQRVRHPALVPGHVLAPAPRLRHQRHQHHTAGDQHHHAVQQALAGQGPAPEEDQRLFSAQSRRPPALAQLFHARSRPGNRGLSRRPLFHQTVDSVDAVESAGYLPHRHVAVLRRLQLHRFRQLYRSHYWQSLLRHIHVSIMLIRPP